MNSILPDIKDIKDIVWVFDPLTLIALIFLLIAVGLISYLIYQRLTKKNKTSDKPSSGKIQEDTTPFWIKLREKLEKLDAVDFYTKQLFKQYSIEISEIIREFLATNYLIDTYDKTSSEIMEQMGIRERDFQRVRVVEEFLRFCDIVKFAKYKPTLQEMKDIKEKAIYIVTEFVKK